MDNNSLRMGYVMVSRHCCWIFMGNGVRPMAKKKRFCGYLLTLTTGILTVLHGGVQVACGRGRIGHFLSGVVGYTGMDKGTYTAFL